MQLHPCLILLNKDEMQVQLNFELEHVVVKTIQLHLYT